MVNGNGAIDAALGALRRLAHQPMLDELGTYYADLAESLELSDDNLSLDLHDAQTGSLS